MKINSFNSQIKMIKPRSFGQNCSNDEKLDRIEQKLDKLNNNLRVFYDDNTLQHRNISLNTLEGRRPSILAADHDRIYKRPDFNDNSPYTPPKRRIADPDWDD